MAIRLLAAGLTLCLISTSSSYKAAPAFLPAFAPFFSLHGRAVHAGLCLSTPKIATPQPPSPGSLRASPLIPGITRSGALSCTEAQSSGASQASEDPAASVVQDGQSTDPTFTWKSQKLDE